MLKCHKFFPLVIDDEEKETMNPENLCLSEDITSIHGGQIGETHDVPLDVIIRPIPSQLDEAKVLSLMQTIQVCIGASVKIPLHTLCLLRTVNTRQDSLIFTVGTQYLKLKNIAHDCSIGNLQSRSILPQ